MASGIISDTLFLRSPTATDVDRTWGSGPEVSGPVCAVAAWLTRSDASGLSGDVPEPPTWV